MKRSDSDLDALILAQLRADGRASNRQIARTLRVSENAVRQHVRRMEDTKRLRISLIFDPRKRGLHAITHLWLTITPRHLSTCLLALNALDETAVVCRTSGIHNAYCVLVAKDLDAINDLLETKVRRLAGIQELRTSSVFKVFKHRYDLARFV